MKRHETWSRRKDTPEDSRRHEKARDRGGDWEATRGGRLVPPQAGRPGPEANHLSLHVTQSNRPLRRILTLDSSRFDPRAMVHPTELYNQTQTPPEASIIIRSRQD
jgi:hypothetical protein